MPEHVHVLPQIRVRAVPVALLPVGLAAAVIRLGIEGREADRLGVVGECPVQFTLAQAKLSPVIVGERETGPEADDLGVVRERAV